MLRGAAYSKQPLFLLCFVTSVSFCIDSSTNSLSTATGELQFTSANGYNATIYENSRPRTYLGSSQLMGINLLTLPPLSYLRFYIKDGDKDGFFTAEMEETGDVAVLLIRTRTGLSDVLNRERTSQYHLTVVAEARSSIGKVSATTAVKVQVLDINDNIPLFLEDSYNVLIREDASLHSSVLTVSAEDADDGSNGRIYYALEDPAIDTFCVHPTSGVVSLARPLDYDKESEYHFVILAEDRGVKIQNRGPGSASRTSVHASILKVNLHSPLLKINHLPHVVEHAHTHIYAIITVTDEDSGENGEIKSVDIVNGDPNRLFTIMKGSKSFEYNLAVLKLLDRELAPSGYNLTVKAVDKGYPPRKGVANVRVAIADINDQAPVFLKKQYDEAVSEEAPPNTPVVRVAASDIDQGSNGQVLFRIVAGNDNDKFTINQYTGLIYTRGWLDAETTGYYSLAVSAVDQASNAQRKQSSAKVTIRVVDCNDNAPVFSSHKSEVFVDENEPSGSYVTKLLATDNDSGENGFVSYSIANLDEVPFNIDPFDGTIRTGSVLDFEAGRRFYTIRVRASDWGQPLKMETETNVVVKVRDVNDNRPVFVGGTCSGFIDLDAPLGTSVTKFQAVDLDDGDRVHYKLEESDLRDCWSLDSSSGVLSLSCKLRERYSQVTKKTLIINITASDGKHISDKATLSIAVLDKDSDPSWFRRNSAGVACDETNIISKISHNNDLLREISEVADTFAILPPRYGDNSHFPEFPQNLPEVIDLREDCELGWTILSVNASDHDRGNNGRIVYSIASGDVDSVFKIDMYTGIISLDALLDRERSSQYVLNITVYDLGVPPKVSSRNVTINVLDVNDNIPEFSQLSYRLHLPENTLNGTSVAHITAKDDDYGLNGKITYELVTKVKEFIIDPYSGYLYLASTLDRELRAEYDLRVRAWDNAVEDSKSSMARILITVLDINDCPPEFGSSKFLVTTINEDIPAGAVVANLQAVDNDLGPGGVVMYSLVSGHHGAFRIDPYTGIVRVISRLFYERFQVYNITVKASDKGSPVLSNEANLVVHVTKVDQTSFPPSLTKRVLRANVLENQPPGTFVTKVEAYDSGLGNIHYEVIGGSGYGLFTINNKGDIRTVVRLDRETTKGYWLTISLSDGSIVPQLDTCHTEFPVYRPTISEDSPVGTTVVILRATDDDLMPSNISFSISRNRRRRNGWMLSQPDGEEDPYEVFDIEKYTGVVTVKATLDRERQSEYDVWVMVSDGQLSSLTPLFINVLDVNDNAPEFPDKVYRFNVPARDNPEKTEPLFRIFAVDKDEGRNADIRYSFKSKKDKSRFEIDDVTGHLFTTRSLPPGQTLELTIKAVDGGQPQLSSTAHVIIRTLRVPTESSHPPRVEVNPTAHVMETDRPGHVVAFINAFDEDNDTLWYSLEDGNIDGRFSVVVDTGVVTLARQLDRESQDKYDLIVAVTDGVFSTKAVLVVLVTDFNDHYPIFSETIYRSSVSEDLKPGSSILKLSCHDRDLFFESSSTSASLNFALRHAESLESSSLFTVDASSGDLILAQPLNRELVSSHTLTVSCEDRLGVMREDLARVVIAVEDSNDHTPVFLESTIEAQVSEDAAVNSLVVRVAAVDEDYGDNGRLSYSIIEGNHGGTFNIDEESGIITLALPLIHKGTSEFLLLVRAIDHAHRPKASSVPVRITVKHSHDTPPTWKGTDLPKIVELSEWTSSKTVVAIVTASSPNSLLYEVVLGNSEQTFVVGPSSGVLSLKLPLDYETTSWYNLTIRATNNLGIFGDTWLGIRVLDENDWSPEWVEGNYDGSVLDSALVGHPVFKEPSGRLPEQLLVAAVDRDSSRNGRIAYSLLNRNLLTLFSVDKFTGMVRVAGSLKEFSGRELALQVWARDSGEPRRECSQAATVNIHIRRSSPPSRPNFSLPEFSGNLYLPTVEGVKITCVNLSTDVSIPVYYRFHASEDHSHFYLDSNGCLYVKNPIDLKHVYNLTVTASPEVVDEGDSNSLASTSVLIHVKNLPPGSVKFTQKKFWANVLENTTNEINLLMVAVKGVPMNHHVTYTLLNANDFFVIRPTSGVLKTTGKPFDREKQDRFALIVEARELERPNKFGQVAVSVNVLDVNDNEPVFVGQPYDVIVTSSAQKGHVVTKVRAIDADEGAFGEVRYELARGSGELFGVEKKTGNIILKQALGPTDKTFSLTVVAYDGAKQPLSSQAHVLVRVVSADGPVFDPAFYLEEVPEDKPVKSAITRIEARSPSGSDLIYTIVAGNSDLIFDLDYRNGVLRLSSPLDFEESTSHNLTLRGLDPKTGLFSDCHALIRVLDVNDDSPRFQMPVFYGEVSEAAYIGYSILTVKAEDRDTGLGGTLRYECQSGCANFTVDPVSGHVVLSGALDAETQVLHRVNVIARDLGTPSLTGSASVVIKVLDMNDNAPVWKHRTYQARVSIEAKAGHVITALSAKDADITNSDGSKLAYQIIGGDPNSLFQLDRNGGLLSVTAPHKLVGGSTVGLNISASDGVHVSFTSLRINVLSANNHSPRFSRATFEGTIMENAPPGEFILSVAVADEDGPPFGVVAFEILGQEKHRMFSVDDQGNIYSEVSLDRETKAAHVIEMAASDGGGKFGFASVRISVQDRNDNAPLFSLPQYQANIPVNLPAGTAVLEVAASDADEGKNSRVKYSLYDTDGTDTRQIFSMDENTGKISLSENVVGRENEVFQFFVRATDGGDPPLHSDAPVTIFLINESEKYPFCSRKYAQFFLQEDAPIGTLVTSLWGSGPMDVKYSIISNEYDDAGRDTRSSIPFDLTPSGEVVVKGALDHDKKRVHRITVVNETLTTPPLVDYMTISIVVMDVNDCSPEFSASSYKADVAENTEVGEIVAKVFAMDLDEGSNGQIRYSLKNTTDRWVKSTISIDPHSGSVILDWALDRESNSSISAIVVATDNGPNPRSAEASLSITILDYNDNPPVFSRDVYVTNVLEDSPVGTVIIELSIKDDDVTAVPLDFFVMGGDDGGCFLVHTSGQVYVARTLDREEKDRYTMIVTATDGKFSANTTVYISVIDVNDNGPTCHEAEYRRIISEDMAVGTHVVSVSVYDPDEGPNARSRFNVTGDGAHHFQVDHLTGKVVTAAPLDRERRDTYQLVVMVEDWEVSEWHCQSLLTVSLTDVNDNPPQFSEPSYSVFISEGAFLNAVLTKLVANDSDTGVNRLIRYSLRDSADEYFEIDPVEGIISVVKPLDRETRDLFRLIVEAKDLGSPSFSSSAVVTVTVTDENDSPPEFVKTLEQVTVAENIPVGADISRVMATSKDIGINAEITYKLQHTTEEEYLRIHPKTGVITVNSPLDYEKVELIVATVIATDGGVPPLSATALLNVTVTDVNDNYPVFAQTSYAAEVLEDSPLRYVFIQVSATDEDSGDFGRVSYAISKGNEDGHFSLERGSGILSLGKALDREQRPEYEIEITASDMGSPPNVAATTVLIRVGDVNDNAPRFSKNNYSTVVQENRPVGYSVLRLTASDADVEPNGRPFTWELIVESWLGQASEEGTPFTIDQDGSLRVATNKLDHRIQSIYEVKVRVWDNGTPPLSSDCIVLVKVVEESRYPPDVHQFHATVISYLGPYPGGVVGKVSASDRDTYDTLKFAIQSDHQDHQNYFAIDDEDGTMVALSPLDEGEYTVNISVSDGKYERSVEADVRVSVIDDGMGENSLIVRLGPISSEEFLAKYNKIFLATLAHEIGVQKGEIQILSVQTTIVDFPEESGRTKTQKTLDVLLVAVRRNGKYLTRERFGKALKRKLSNIRSILSLPMFTVMDTLCNERKTCSKNGVCTDVVHMSAETHVYLRAQSYNLVSPKFSQKPVCVCDRGFDGPNCETLINECGHRPCLAFEECIPSTTISRGYSCQCPAGMAGSRCHINLLECHKKPSCHYPIQPFSFKGKSYAMYSMTNRLDSTSLLFSSYVRTTHPVGIIFFASGDVDYNVLEIWDGYVQYRWDCGSGEGLVRVPHLRVHDSEWHHINLTREGRQAKLMVDGKGSSGASPGVHDILNLDSGNLYIGAKVETYVGPFRSVQSVVDFGFVGCIDMITWNGKSVPVAVDTTTDGNVSLKRLANVELQCPEILPPPGICGSHPCFNGGSCNESGSSYLCSCPSRFTGTQCQIDSAPCSSSPCLNGGKCTVVGQGYVCKCPPKLSGKRCEYGVYCNPNPCQNGGRCKEGSQGPMCKCQHFTGPLCEMDIDECTKSPCQNGGTCLNLFGGFRCICAANVTGEYCTVPLYEPGSSENFFVPFKELIYVFAIVIACVLVALVVVTWQRRRWKYKRHQQNNRVKLMSHHVKNDLKANDLPKRNSKICNVEADQLQYQRPASYTPTGTTDSALLHTLRQLADHEALELSNLGGMARSHEYAHNLSRSSAMTGSPTKPNPHKKPWDHHNNLNQAYFSPNKGVDFDLPPNLAERCPSRANSLNTSNSDNSSVPGNQKQLVYTWNECDQGGSASQLTTFVSPKNSKEDLEVPRPDTEYLDAEAPGENQPFIEGEERNPPMSSASSVPLLRGEWTPYKVLGEEGDEDDEDTFDRVLEENNISASSTDSDTEEEHGSSSSQIPPNVEEEKISNIPKAVNVSSEEANLRAVSFESAASVGSPRSRRPFVRSDFGRASDVSFLSSLDGEVAEEDSEMEETSIVNSYDSLDNNLIKTATYL